MLIQRRKPDYDSIGKSVSTKFECRHKEVEPRKIVKANGSIDVKNQCKKCGTEVGSSISHANFKSGIDGLLPWDKKIADSFNEMRSAYSAKLREQAEKECYLEWKAKYDAYRETDAWKKRRRLVLDRAQGICEGCRSARANQVHHITYVHLGEEFLFELVALCGGCHERVHAEALERTRQPI